MLLIDILAPILDLPEWVTNLSLAHHYGEQMIGSWDPIGGRRLAGAGDRRPAERILGFSRRDLRG
jgi:hypothetical protein